MSYLECLGYTLREESGERQPFDGAPFARGEFSFSDHPRDPGGRTMMGITQAEYDAYRQGRFFPPHDVQKITDEELIDIYHIHYWVSSRAENMPRGVDLAVFDFAVNSGVTTAIKKLQKVLGVATDGHVGLKTQNALVEMHPFDVIQGLMDERRRYCRQLKNYPPFRNGWEKRWQRIEAAAMQMAGDGQVHEPMLVEERAAPAPKAIAARPPTTMLASDTGNMAVVGGTSGVTGVGMSVAKAAGALSASGKPVTIVSLLSTAASSEVFWIGTIALVTGIAIWVERRTKMVRDNT